MVAPELSSREKIRTIRKTSSLLARGKDSNQDQDEARRSTLGCDAFVGLYASQCG